MKNRKIFHGWWLVLVCVVTQAVCIGIINYSYSIFADAYIHEFSIGRATVMLGIGLSTLSLAIMAPLAGSLLDRYPIRRLMALGCLLFAAGLVGAALSPHFWVVLLCYSVPIAGGLMLTGMLPASVLISRWFEKQRGLALGLSALGTSLGGLVFPALSHTLVSGIGWRDTLMVFAVAGLVCCLPLVIAFVRDDPRSCGLLPDGRARAVGTEVASVRPEGGRWPLPRLLRDVNFWLIAGAISVMGGAYSFVLSNTVLIASDAGIPAARATLLLSAMAICSALGKPLFGSLVDRLDMRIMLGLAIVLEGSALMLFMFAADGTGMLLGAIAIGLSTGGMLPVWGALVAKLYGLGDYGRAMGAMTPVVYIGPMLMPYAGGLVFDVTGSYRWAFGGMALLLLLFLALVGRIRSGGQPAAQAAMQQM